MLRRVIAKWCAVGVLIGQACLAGVVSAAPDAGALPVKGGAEPAFAWPDHKDLTPESLVLNFADFTFELGDRLQEPEVFLKRKRGDCDDFAKLASELLTKHGYKTKLVVVMMARETHVVCYVEERKGYLDYNLRAAAEPIVKSDGSLEDVAEKVAASFRSPWRMVSEIRYNQTTPVFVDSAFPLAKPTVAAAPSLTPAMAAKSDVPKTGSSGAGL